jgi:hypothetical protein
VDWNVCFTQERCDQYGNTPTTVRRRCVLFGGRCD